MRDFFSMYGQGSEFKAFSSASYPEEAVDCIQSSANRQMKVTQKVNYVFESGCKATKCYTRATESSELEILFPTKPNPSI
jgi:hypothetical protein